MWGSPDTYLAIIVTAVVTTALAWWRESRARDRSEAREDRLRKEAEDRDDRLRQEAQARQDQVTASERAEWAYQQWWSRKFDAYDEVLRALWHRLDYSNLQYDSYLEGDGSTKDTYQPFDFRANRETLFRAMEIGAFLLSPSAEEALRSYQATINRLSAEYPDNNPMDIWGEDIDALRLTIDRVRLAALADLRLDGYRPVEP